MRASWFSQKGRERARNSDAAAVGQQGQHLLAVLVDGAEKGQRGAELARHWADVVWQAMAETAGRSPSEVHTRLKREQAQLRHGFLRDIGSYCMVALDLDTLTTQVWHCGDCRVGLNRQTETKWLTKPHILAEQPGIPCPRTREDRDRHEQLLTRRLSAKRFEAPDYQSLLLKQGQALLLSTDGYWQEHLEGAVSLDQVRDDASLLMLPVGLRSHDKIDKDSDADNLKYFQYG